ncbi:phage SPO1 DNA polymerase-related protein [Thiothrix nivea DSM 5205]|uniref:Type-4 uracil-DNA glycosylase n=2 Tax=Thiothrix nivea TaxID=1031 RepID=A0A656HK70_THINJ|nr:phage SPO1 DNA polymerase-related protein [Thiothrix nivea DSM 5205]
MQAMGIPVWRLKDTPPPVVVSSVPASLERNPSPIPPLSGEGGRDVVVSSSSPDKGRAGRVSYSHMDWQELRATVLACTRCDISKTRANAVFGIGNQQADWMVIGEAPGAEEDKQGEPFVGKAGQLLNNMLLAIGMPRATVYIANILKCRPPNNRDPKPDEATNCRGYLERQIELVNPALILVVGRIAAQNLLQTDAPLARLRGREHRAPLTGTPVIVTYHPAYLLRQPADKRKAWQDLLLAREISARSA